MSEELRVEGSGETVGEAKWAAVRELERLVPGLDREDVRFEVVSEGQRGLLGVGYAPAKVIAYAVRPDRPAGRRDVDESTEAARARDVVERIVAGIGAACRVTVEEDRDEILVTLSGPDLGILIGRHGQTIDAIQYLANAIARRERDEEHKHVTIDASGYRARRTASIEAVAQRTAEQVAATGQRSALEPMTAVERKIVHEVLKDDPEVETESEGTEPNRYVVVLPRHLAH